MDEIHFENDKKDFMKGFMSDKKRNQLILISSVIAAVLIIIFFLLFRFFTPFGAIVSYQFNSMLDRDKLSKIKGAEETSSFNPTQQGVLQIPQQTIRQNVVTFNLKLITKPIEGVWVNLKFKGNTKEIKIGVRGSEKEQYFYQPLYQQQLEQLKMQATANNLLFWQKEPIYAKLEQFIEKPPVDKITATYFFNVGDFSLSQQKVSSPSEKNTIFTRALRGSHTLFIRVDNKPLNITIEKQDSNAYKGEDVLLIELYKGDKQIMKKEIPDDGISETSNLKMNPQTEQIKIDSLESGVHKLVLTDKSSGADVNITKIETNQSGLIVSSPLYILDNRPATVWTNSKKITVTTWHDESLQTVKLDNLYDLKIDKTNKNYEFNLNKPETADNTRELHQLDIPKNDLIISGDGYFSFSKDSFFNPEPIKTVNLTALSDISKIDYIIANYQQAKKEGEWYTAQAYFDPKDIKIDGDKLYFSLESPELNSYGGEIVIDSLEVTVKKPGWFSGQGVQNAGETGNVVEKKTVKQNIFSRFFDWTGEKMKVIGKAIASPFVSAWNWTRGVFVNKPATKPVPKRTPSVKVTPTPISPIATSSATPATAAKIDLLVRVLNGGGEKGSAASVAAILKAANFTNVIADNADKYDYKGATIQYRKIDEALANIIESLIKKEYVSIAKVPVSTTTAEILLIVGKK